MDQNPAQQIPKNPAASSQLGQDGQVPVEQINPGLNTQPQDEIEVPVEDVLSVAEAAVADGGGEVQSPPLEIPLTSDEPLIQAVDEQGHVTPLDDSALGPTPSPATSQTAADTFGQNSTEMPAEEAPAASALEMSQLSQAEPMQESSSQPLSLSTNTPTTGGLTLGSLIDVLKSKGLLSPGQYDEVKVESAKSGKRPEDIVMDKGLVSEEAFAQAKAEYLNVPFKKLGEVAVSPEALAVIPEAVARRYKTLPFLVDKSNNTLSVAMANPLDLKAIDFVEKKTGMRVIPHLVTESDLTLAFSEQYARSLSGEVTQALADQQESAKRTIDVTQLGQVIREAPIAKIVETLLTFALRSRASDVHIEPQEARTRVRYRIDGILQEKLVLPNRVHDALVSRIKILARLKIDERRLPQDGRFGFTANNEEVDLRVSTLPTVHGEKVVMRLLKKTSVVPTLPDLGLRGRALKNFQEAITVPHGIVLITGPTGSGKTTTLYAVLSKINTPKVNIVTLEDPVEYEIPGVNQVQVNPKAGLSFASGLRSFLRQDPNVIMVGEIRDSETADLAIQASLTGHLVFSTLHTNSSAGALPRLLDMEAEPFLLASSMTSVVAQRVVRKICEHCREEYTPESEVIEDIKEVLGSLYDGYMRQKNEGDRKVLMYRGKGCTECGESGYQGRMGIFEVMVISEAVSKLILERAPASSIEKQALSEGMILMKQDGYLKALEGITTIEEVLRVAEV